MDMADIPESQQTTISGRPGQLFTCPSDWQRADPDRLCLYGPACGNQSWLVPGVHVILPQPPNTPRDGVTNVAIMQDETGYTAARLATLWACGARWSPSTIIVA